MKEFTTSKGEYLLVKVPKDAYKFITECFDSKVTKVPITVLDYQCKSTPDRGNKLNLYNGNYTFLCTNDGISEEVADSIVDKVGNRHYQDYNGLADYCVFALRSFKSLLQKLNLSPDKNYAICKKN